MPDDIIRKHVIAVPHFPPGTKVWNPKGHGLINRVPLGLSGEVAAIRDDGRVVVNWENGKTSTRSPALLSTGANVDPEYADLIEQALALVDQPDDRPPVYGPDTAYAQAWEAGWDSRGDADREALEYVGLIYIDGEVYEGRVHRTTPPRFRPGQQVFAFAPHGGPLGRAVLAGASGRVTTVLPDGRLVVDWDKGETTTTHPNQLCTEADMEDDQ